MRRAAEQASELPFWGSFLAKEWAGNRRLLWAREMSGYECVSLISRGKREDGILLTSDLVTSVGIII